MNLRPYQQRVVDEFFQSPTIPTAIVSPTGSGKTVIGRAIADRFSSQLWVAHRTELISQCERPAVSIQSLLNMSSPPSADIIVFDELHHLASKEWKRVWEIFSGKAILGLTATPERSDGATLGGDGMFLRMLVAANYSELIRDGNILACDVFSPPERQKNLAQDPFDVVANKGNRSVVFCATVDEAQKLADRLGPGARCVEGDMKDKDRAAALGAFAKGELHCLTNVYVLTEGWDCPSADTCVIARGVGSVTPWLQMVGRVLRPLPGKRKPSVYDLTGCVWELGHPCMDREFTLSSGIKVASKGGAIWACKHCGYCALAPISPCPKCGGDIIKKKPIPVRNRDLVWVCPNCGNAHDRMPLICHHCETSSPRKKMADSDSQSERQRYLRSLKEKAESMGYSPGWIFYRYKAKYGVSP